MISDVLLIVTQAAMLTFVVASMAAMGLSLTLEGIAEPLRDWRMVVLLLVANFVVVPVTAVAAGRLLPMDEAAATAVILLGCCAGAPFLPKLAQLARGDVALSVGAMVFLMVFTVFYAPVIVPLVVEGAVIDPWDIAGSLIVLMLVPLTIGLLVKARYEELADGWVGTVGQASSVALLLGIGAALLVTWQDLLGAIGSWVFVGTGILLAAGLIGGYIAGVGRSRGDTWPASMWAARALSTSPAASQGCAISVRLRRAGGTSTSTSAYAAWMRRAWSGRSCDATSSRMISWRKR
jgi:BASS family bile acid:Na+ symporter